jgi:hypothetical protein
MNSKRFIFVAAMVIFVLSTPSAPAEEKVMTMDMIICAIGPHIITLEQIGVERAILEIAGDAVVYPEATKSAWTNQKVFHELVVRLLLTNVAGRMGFSEVDPKDVEKTLEEFRKKFDSTKAYRDFLKHRQLTDSYDETISGKDEFSGDIVYRFRNIVMVRQFTHKKLDIQVKLSMKTASSDDGLTPDENASGAAPNATPNMREEKLFHKLLLEWVSELAARERISIRDEFYRGKLEKLLGMQ